MEKEKRRREEYLQIKKKKRGQKNCPLFSINFY